MTARGGITSIPPRAADASPHEYRSRTADMKARWAVSSRIESADVQAREQSDSDPPRERHGGSGAPGPRLVGVRVLKAALHTTVFLCLAATLAHVVLVFFHVAPPNPVSRRYSQQIDAWVYPLFEQNWRLFAPNPDSVNRQVLARTAHVGPHGSMQVSPWFDLSAVDSEAVEHQAFPSHTAQNLLRRAWATYTETHGKADTALTERAVMIQKYLNNIAADRITEHRGDSGLDIDFIQLRVITLPVAAPGSHAADRPPKSVENRLLPWWKVTSHEK
ncbi:DUF5819 family protein [Streptomyces sp. 378]|uniref:DUF5819 family protein n=1 Tax=Streptomyces sp. 378 TaxID=3049412 RepID=UPI0024C35054|nr:DUF5819 family protein [Streptomyces sp. 378]MDK1347369.1 DUF5819 family protein [Streptomyces sp. 378]